jgi:hypothetical protein
MGKLHGGIRTENIKPPGLDPAALYVLLPYQLGQPQVASSNNAATFQGSNLLTATSIGSTTSASGTQPDLPRNIRYQVTISGDATGMISAGTISVAGLNVANGAITETIALSAIASATSVEGTKVFASLNASAITVSGYLLATASSTRSNSISVYLGWGARIGLPNSVQSSGTKCIPAVYFESTNAVSRDTAYTVHTGDRGQAAIECSAYATNRGLLVYQFLNR